MEKYNFKLLTLAAVLALYNCAYRGTIEDMCEYLGEDKNEEAIITAIEQLEKKGMIKFMIDKYNVYTISLSVKAEKKKDVVAIQKKWTEIKGAKVSWESVLRAWLANEEEKCKKKVYSMLEVWEWKN